MVNFRSVKDGPQVMRDRVGNRGLCRRDRDTVVVFCCDDDEKMMMTMIVMMTSTTIIMTRMTTIKTMMTLKVMRFLEIT